jgi:hypothetical protein
VWTNDSAGYINGTAYGNVIGAVVKTITHVNIDRRTRVGAARVY